MATIKNISEQTLDVLTGCPLFKTISRDEISEYLANSGSKLCSFKKGELIFDMDDSPADLLILIKGSVDIGKIFLDGRRSIVTHFDEPGEIFGEVLLFLNKNSYEHFGEAIAQSEVLMVPKKYILSDIGIGIRVHRILSSNMINILAQKAFYLNGRVRLLLGSTLRSKIAYLIVNETKCDPNTPLVIGREKLSELLGAARPSVSRELMKMHDEGLINVDGKKIYGVDFDSLADLI
mgnify:CR=1 FL=1